MASDTIALCSKYGVPVLIYDRVDVALASGAAGVHIGQSDIPLSIACNLLPPNMIIGVSCATPEHARKAVEEGADYVSFNSVYDTSTDVSAPVDTCSIAGIRAMLGVLEGTGVKAVVIGSYLFLRSLYPAPLRGIAKA
jgi:thiamine-phosphate diphosphorylase / hydroxyethylthiazole kinase